MPQKGETKTVGNKPYEWNGRRWVPARDRTPVDETGKPQRSDYGSGRSGGKAFADAMNAYSNGKKPPATAQPPESSGTGQGGGTRPIAGLPSDLKETEKAAGEAAEAYRPGAGFPAPAQKPERETGQGGFSPT